MKTKTFEKISNFLRDVMLIWAFFFSSFTTMAFVASETGRSFSSPTIFDVVPIVLMIYLATRIVVEAENASIVERVDGWWESEVSRREG